MLIEDEEAHAADIANMEIVWDGQSHHELEKMIRQFCLDFVHPRQMFVLQLPIIGGDGEFVGCYWSEDRGVLVARYYDDPAEMVGGNRVREHGGDEEYAEMARLLGLEGYE